MAEFIINKEAEVIGGVINTIIGAMPEKIKTKALKFLKGYYIQIIDKDEWYRLQPFLEFLKIISLEHGNAVLFNIGQAITKQLKLDQLAPVSIENIIQLLQTITSLYQKTHRNGDHLGGIEIINHDKANGKIIVKTTTPYPCEYDRGAFSAFSAEFSRISYVELDMTKPNKRNGANESWFIIDYVV